MLRPFSADGVDPRAAPFETERARVEHLFARYQALTTLFPEKPKKKPRK